jgi:hypothetical protein
MLLRNPKPGRSTARYVPRVRVAPRPCVNRYPVVQPNDQLDLDVLIIGGGIQGLVLLEQFTRGGYSTVLSTSAARPQHVVVF